MPAKKQAKQSAKKPVKITSDRRAAAAIDVAAGIRGSDNATGAH